MILWRIVCLPVRTTRLRLVLTVRKIINFRGQFSQIQETRYNCEHREVTDCTEVKRRRIFFSFCCDLNIWLSSWAMNSIRFSAIIIVSNLQTTHIKHALTTFNKQLLTVIYVTEFSDISTGLEGANGPDPWQLKNFRIFCTVSSP